MPRLLHHISVRYLLKEQKSVNLGSIELFSLS